MIQRIQTVYLLLTTILAVFFLTGSILIFSSATGDQLIIKLTGIYTGNGHAEIEKIATPIFLSAILLLIPFTSLITIFLYKNRKLQIKLNLILLILILVLVLLILIHVFALSSDFRMNLSPDLKMILPLFMLISSVLSYSAIKKDDELVKSYDRLR
jgi:hypothetical protein